MLRKNFAKEIRNSRAENLKKIQIGEYRNMVVPLNQLDPGQPLKH